MMMVRVECFLNTSNVIDTLKAPRRPHRKWPRTLSPSSAGLLSLNTTRGSSTVLRPSFFSLVFSGYLSISSGSSGASSRTGKLVSIYFSSDLTVANECVLVIGYNPPKQNH